MRLRHLRSLWLRLAVVAAVMLAAPAIIYQQLLDADEKQGELLRQSVEAQGRLIARGLTPVLDPARLPDLNDELARYDTPSTHIRLLFRPTGEVEDVFFFVAAAPPLPVASVDPERVALLATGALNHIGMDCGGGGDKGAAYETVTGDRRVIASVAPVALASGCWVVILTRQEVIRFGPAGERPYWRTPALIASAVIYVVMIGLVLLILLSVRRDLGRFTATAARAGAGAADARFRDQNHLPELDAAATAFDRMLENLRRAAANLSRLAEENAHALKTPVGVISQALEPLRKSAEGDARKARSVELIDKSVERLDHLITVIRRSEETAATLVAPELEPLDVVALTREVADAYRPVARDRGIELSVRDGPTRLIMANRELMRTAIENPLENALELTPEGGSVSFAIEQSTGGYQELRITDTGPGAADHNLENLFDRRFSARNADDEGHDGLGLWIVRRNMEAMGGSARAENSPDAGLTVILRIPQV